MINIIILPGPISLCERVLSGFKLKNEDVRFLILLNESTKPNFNFAKKYDVRFKSINNNSRSFLSNLNEIGDIFGSDELVISDFNYLADPAFEEFLRLARCNAASELVLKYTNSPHTNLFFFKQSQLFFGIISEHVKTGGDNNQPLKTVLEKKIQLESVELDSDLFWPLNTPENVKVFQDYFLNSFACEMRNLLESAKND